MSPPTTTREAPRPLPFRVLLITDEDACAKRGRSVVDTVALALASRAEGSAVLLRDKRGSAADVESTARLLKPITAAAGALLLVHTHVDVAERVGAFGVHVADGVAAPSSSRLLVGASRHAPAAIDDDVRGLDYVLLAPVFAPSSKPADERPPLGLQTIAVARRQSRLPVIALGGVDVTNARACLDAGASAVAVLGAVMSAEDPRAALSSLLRATRHAGSAP